MFQEFPDDSKNDDFLNEFRQKIADQSAANSVSYTHLTLPTNREV